MRHYMETGRALVLVCALLALAAALPASTGAQRIDLGPEEAERKHESAVLEATVGLETSTEDLRIEASPVRGGGVMVRLQDRFRSVDRIERNQKGDARSVDQQEAP